MRSPCDVPFAASFRCRRRGVCECGNDWNIHFKCSNSSYQMRPAPEVSKPLARRPAFPSKPMLSNACTKSSLVKYVLTPPGQMDNHADSMSWPSFSTTDIKLRTSPASDLLKSSKHMEFFGPQGSDVHKCSGLEMPRKRQSRSKSSLVAAPEPDRSKSKRQHRSNVPRKRINSSNNSSTVRQSFNLGASKIAGVTVGCRWMTARDLGDRGSDVERMMDESTATLGFPRVCLGGGVSAGAAAGATATEALGFGFARGGGALVSPA
mmetsp:Transcript_14397/g.41393  ORF Transcript_14397/g.41393 Transcript_14397/m.41393 type:complete len:264 (+) Transcript_14397:306-1097(+)